MGIWGAISQSNQSLKKTNVQESINRFKNIMFNHAKRCYSLLLCSPCSDRNFIRMHKSGITSCITTSCSTNTGSHTCTNFSTHTNRNRFYFFSFKPTCLRPVCQLRDHTRLHQHHSDRTLHRGTHLPLIYHHRSSRPLWVYRQLYHTLPE